MRSFRKFVNDYVCESYHNRITDEDYATLCQCLDIITTADVSQVNLKIWEKEVGLLEEIICKYDIHHIGTRTVLDKLHVVVERYLDHAKEATDGLLIWREVEEQIKKED